MLRVASQLLWWWLTHQLAALTVTELLQEAMESSTSPSGEGSAGHLWHRIVTATRVRSLSDLQALPACQQETRTVLTEMLAAGSATKQQLQARLRLRLGGVCAKEYMTLQQCVSTGSSLHVTEVAREVQEAAVVGGRERDEGALPESVSAITDAILQCQDDVRAAQRTLDATRASGQGAVKQMAALVTAVQHIRRLVALDAASGELGPETELDDVDEGSVLAALDALEPQICSLINRCPSVPGCEPG